MSNRFFGFLAIARKGRRQVREHGLEARLVPLEKLRGMIQKGTLAPQTHIGWCTRGHSRHGLAGLRRQFLR